MGRILLVEDERHDSASQLHSHLQAAGHEIEHVGDGEVALKRILAEPPALTLLDVVLPRIDGMHVLQQVRSQGNHPVIVLTGRTHEADRLLALDMGADDYVCRPFSPREVVARIQTVLRRHAQWCVGATRPSTAVRFDEARGNACLEGQALRLTRRELLLLRVLSRDPGRVFTRSRLLEAAFPEAFDVNERAVDGHIKNLRRKLSAAVPSHDWIRSVYGVGFSFAERPT